MKNRANVLVWAVVLVVFLAGCGFVGFKLWQRHKGKQWALENQRWEVKLPVALQQPVTGGEMDEVLADFNGRLERYEVLRPVIDELDLVTVWGLAGPDAAMERLKESVEFRDSGEPATLHFVASDKDRDRAQKIAQAVGRSFDMALQRDRLLAPPMPAGFGE